MTLQVQILYGLEEAPKEYDGIGIDHHADYDLVEGTEDVIAGLGATEHQALRIADEEEIPRETAAERINKLIDQIGTHQGPDKVEGDNIEYPQAYSRVFYDSKIEQAVIGENN